MAATDIGCERPVNSRAATRSALSFWRLDMPACSAASVRYLGGRRVQVDPAHHCPRSVNKHLRRVPLVFTGVAANVGLGRIKSGINIQPGADVCRADRLAGGL